MSSASFIGAIDQGTSSSRFLIFDDQAQVVCSHQVEYSNNFPKAGWVEKDPAEIVDSVEQAIAGAVDKFVRKGHRIEQIKSVGITNQRETTIAWDSETGAPLCPAIIWSDTRTKDLVHRLCDEAPANGKDYLHKICGLPITTYFSAVKMKWLIENVPEVMEAQKKGTLRFGTVDTWLIYTFTGEYVTDVTNASRTMLMNIRDFKWDETALDFFQISRTSLPEIRSSSEIYGHFRDGLLKDIPIAGALGDQQAATVGQSCFEVGQAKNTYGTGCFMLFNTGEEVVFSDRGLLTTVCYQLGPNAKPAYALEGSIAVAGSAIQWLRDRIGLIQSAPEIGLLTDQVEDNGGVYFVTAFSGLFAPYWRDDARGCIVGLTQFTERGHIARACLESVCFQTKAILEAMHKDGNQNLNLLKVDGGMTNSDQCMQIQADILGIKVVRPAMTETTALGAAFAAGLAVGIWESVEALRKLSSSDVQVFWPKTTPHQREEQFSGWNKAVERSLNWA
ncbi:Glycerol kinase [Mycoemilia scoparia]|uniref:Probable glycerol kinase n=1 Tax=Mycoemilia scoparia TaxID=417184 RepID=A0A9W7ZVP8_9FUNG|nr:Glycerol kinase [Mycoemilia scoparia]